MTALVRAELLKLRTVRLPLWLLLTTLALVTLGVLATALTAGLEGAPLQRDDPALLARSVASAAVGNVVVLVLGILTLTQEFRFGTATPSFLVTPRRSRVLVAKLIAIAVTGLGFALVSAALAVGLSAVLLPLRGGVVTWDRTVLEVLLGVVLLMVLYGPIGIAVGALVRNQIAAVVGSLAWIFVVEQLLVALLPAVGRWTPGGASSAVLQLGD
ncbi:MAG: ABC transporter permease, partial [Frankiales bacterium]|nr:ABC transporter permease [Frankiales bacterium]